MAMTRVGVVEAFAPLRAQDAMMMAIRRHDLRFSLAYVGHVHGHLTASVVAKHDATTRWADESGVVTPKIALMKDVQDLMSKGRDEMRIQWAQNYFVH